MQKINLSVLYIALFLLLCSCKKQVKEVDKTKGQPRPNVLFICVDDLRPELGCYGADYMHTPNIDRLARLGVAFTHHYASVPTSGASRYGMLTGMYPRNKQEISNEAARTELSDKAENKRMPETFVHRLRLNGYRTVGIGKISHYVDGLLYGYTEQPGTRRELPHSWDELLFDPGKWGTGWNAFFGYADGSNRQSRNKQVKPYERGEVDDTGYPDGLTANLAVKKLRELAQRKGAATGEQPFFLGVGFFKPHLPFNAPAKYWDLYDEATLPLTPSPNLPADVNRNSLHGSGEFNGYLLGEEKASLNKPLSDAYARKLRHAYFAAVSYTDAQIGKLLDVLDELGLTDNTLIVLWGDHGWHLGDQRVWGKHTLFERSLNCPLIIKAPKGASAVGNGQTAVTQSTSAAGNGQTAVASPSAGIRCDKIVSSVDIYPTVVDLCGLELPHATDGASLTPLLVNPGGASDWREASYSYFKNGITLRTHRYRLTKYLRSQQPVVELYDHRTDPYENRNIAAEHPEIVEQLMPLWEKGSFNFTAVH